MIVVREPFNIADWMNTENTWPRTGYMYKGRRVSQGLVAGNEILYRDYVDLEETLQDLWKDFIERKNAQTL